MKIFSTVAQKTHQGFTFVELIVALAIVIILTAIAVPSVSNFIQQIRLSSATNELYSAINLTKAEAIKRNGKVDMAAIDGNWKNGWIISSADNERIMTHEPLHHDITISAKFNDSAQHIAFSGSGRSRTNSSSATSLSGHIYLAIGDKSRLISLNLHGHARLCNPAIDKSCTVSSTD